MARIRIMMQVTRSEAKEHFDDLIEAAMRSETVLIKDTDEQGKQTVQMVALPAKPARRPRKVGNAKGSILYMADDFDAPLEDFREYMEMPEKPSEDGSA